MCAANVNVRGRACQCPLFKGATRKTLNNQISSSVGDSSSRGACGAVAAGGGVPTTLSRRHHFARHMEQLVKANQGTIKIVMKPEPVKAYISHEPHQVETEEKMSTPLSEGKAPKLEL